MKIDNNTFLNSYFTQKNMIQIGALLEDIGSLRKRTNLEKIIRLKR